MKINKLTKMLGASIFLIVPLAVIPTITSCSSEEDDQYNVSVKVGTYNGTEYNGKPVTLFDPLEISVSSQTKDFVTLSCDCTSPEKPDVTLSVEKSDTTKAFSLSKQDNGTGKLSGDLSLVQQNELKAFQLITSAKNCKSIKAPIYFVGFDDIHYLGFDGIEGIYQNVDIDTANDITIYQKDGVPLIQGLKSDYSFVAPALGYAVQQKTTTKTTGYDTVNIKTVIENEPGFLVSKDATPIGDKDIFIAFYFLKGELPDGRSSIQPQFRLNPNISDGDEFNAGGKTIDVWRLNSGYGEISYSYITEKVNDLYQIDPDKSSEENLDIGTGTAGMYFNITSSK